MDEQIWPLGFTLGNVKLLFLKKKRLWVAIIAVASHREGERE